MSSNISLIAKDDLPAYESWKLDDFSHSKRTRGSDLVTVEQLERLHEQARSEGYAAGYQQGAEQARNELDRIRSLMSDLDRELRRFDQGVANNMVSLTLEMTRQVLRTSLTRRPDLVVEVVKEAMQTLPPFGEHAQLLLNPADAVLVRQHIGDQIAHSKWRLIEDASIERGGCRVQTATVEIDATLPTRWQRMAATLARHEAWYRDPAFEAALVDNRAGNDADNGAGNGDGAPFK